VFYDELLGTKVVSLDLLAGNFFADDFSAVPAVLFGVF
jgi:hypothetical protein